MEQIKAQNIFKLDEKDKKILVMLDIDARMSLTDISKKTGIPVDTVKYRIEKMESNEILQYQAIIDPELIGYPILNEVHFQLVNFSTQEQERIKKYVTNNPYIIYGVKLSGKHDYAIAIIAKDARQFDSVFNEFKTVFQNIIKDYDVNQIIEEYKFDYMLDLIGLDK